MKVFFVNSQTVQILEDGKRYKHLVVGANDIPNLKGFEKTVNRCKDRGLLQIAGLSESMYPEKFQELFLPQYDAVETHNAQIILPAMFSNIPLIGKYSKKSNQDAVKVAEKYHKPPIASSNAHRAEDLGFHTLEYEGEIKSDSEEVFMCSLRRSVIETELKK